MAARKTKTASEPKIRKRGVAPFIEKYYNEYYTIETYPADKCVAFNTVAGEWGILGNFARTPLVVNGVTFSSSEQLYQIMKFKDADVIRNVYAGVTFKGINKGTVKMVARSYENQGFRREDWGWILLDALKFCIQIKYEQSEAFRNELERSRGFFIVEDQTGRKKGKDAAADTWGALLKGDSYVGTNLMGRLLMEIRDNGKLEYRLPEDTLDYIACLQ